MAEGGAVIAAIQILALLLLIAIAVTALLAIVNRFSHRDLTIRRRPKDLDGRVRAKKFRHG